MAGLLGHVHDVPSDGWSGAHKPTTTLQRRIPAPSTVIGFRNLCDDVWHAIEICCTSDCTRAKNWSGGAVAAGVKCLILLVELRGIEPRTSCMPCKRSPS
jgi:hypothetical protein